MKAPWHQPTCKECAHVFPTACGSQINDYVETQKAQELEEAARVYCYLEAFGSMLPNSPPSTSPSLDVVSSSSRRLQGSSSSSESSSSGGEQDMQCGTPYGIPYEALEEVKKRVDSGALTCPGDWCLTQNPELFDYQPVGYFQQTSKYTETGIEAGTDMTCPESLTGLDSSKAGNIPWYDPVNYYQPLW
eukprot:scaffold287678_cov37-Prasinocladus_malaysianus.AAC.1